MEQPATAALEIRLFGTMEVRIGGHPLPPLRSKRGRWLLALLTLRHDRDTEREWLAGTLWPDSTEEQALANLRRTLTDLREALGEAAACLYAPTPQTLRLKLAAADADLIAFDRAAASRDVSLLQEAMRLYRGPLLEGWTEDWALEARLIRAESYQNVLETLAAQSLEAGKPDAAIPYLRQTLVADPFRETACRTLLQALFANGNFAAVTETYRNFRLLLRRELNAEPDPQTIALYRRLRTETRQRTLETSVPSSSAPKATPSHAKTGFLPRPLTAFLGRETDLPLLTERIETERLVTLTGIGGVGKTRLAIQTATESEEAFAGGAWFIDLSPLTDAAHVPQAFAAVLGVREQPERSLQESLRDFLAPQEILLVLDNCEHLLETCAYLVESLLEHAPGLHVLVTSRQPLGLTGESVWRVAPLALPESVPEDATALAALLERCDATRLFLERARASGFAPAPDGRQAQAILRICRRLDGIPLALELAAARVAILSVEQIAQRLDDRFHLLTGGSRTALPRHKTLRALFDWSYELLEESESLLFRRLAIFQGGWNLEAVEGVCADGTNAVPPTGRTARQADAAMDTLASLVDKSLVIREPRSGTPRYRMLESVREYARERLEESGEADSLRDSHAAYFLRLAQENSDALRGAAASEALHTFADDLENFRKGMDSTLDNGDKAATIAYGMALFGFLRTRGLYTECTARLGLAIDAARETDDHASLARLLNQKGLVAWERFDLETAAALFTESYRLSQELDDKPRMLSALVNLGNIAWGRSDFAGAYRVYTEALQIARETAQERHEGTLLLNLGTLAIERGDYADAESALEAGLRIHERLQSDEYIAHTYYNLAELYRRQGQHEAALDYTQRSRHLYETLGNRRGLALAEVRIGINLLESGQPEAARNPVQEGLRIAREIGDRAGEMYALEVQARLQGMAGDLAGAEALFRLSLTLANQVGDRKHSVQTLAHYAEILLMDGQTAKAYRLLQVAQHEGERLGLKDETLEACLHVVNSRLSSEEKAALDRETNLPETLFPLLNRLSP